MVSPFTKAVLVILGVVLLDGAGSHQYSGSCSKQPVPCPCGG